MNVLWETMVAEMRALRAELDHRRHFTAEKQPIETARELLSEWTEPKEAEPLEIVVSRTASNMRTAAEHDLFEVG
jgi:hypothetical protein